MEEQDIFQQIEDLDTDIKSVRDFIAKLKPVLRELAYYAMSGDSAILETREKWHTMFTNQIREEIGSSAQSAQSAQSSSQPSMSSSMASSMAFNAPTFNEPQSNRPILQSNRLAQPNRTLLQPSRGASHISFK
jgi:hypothetical protein